MKKLVIFDLDGTLLNTIADLAHSTNHALRQNGFPTHDVKEYNFFVGNGINKLFERALPEGEKTAENILKVREEFLKHYDLHNTDRSVPYPGVPELLALLQERGIKLAVASNKYQAATRKLIAHFFPSIQFTEVLGQREGVKAKPDPSIVNEIVERASISKESTLYVGDSDVDMQTAINMGLSPSYGIREIRTRSYSGKGRRYTQVYLKDDLSLSCEAILPVLVSHACP